MGYGDDLMATGWAKRLGGKWTPGNGQRVAWSEVFDHNPQFSRMPCGNWMFQYPGRRQYILGQSADRVFHNSDHRPPVGVLNLTTAEKAKAPEGRYALLEPYTKGTFAGNKDWPPEYWLELLKLTPEIRWVQCVYDGCKPLPGVETVATRTFREACGVVNGAAVLCTTDGGLHHAAAALDRRAVVLWSGLVSPEVLGYPAHRNLTAAEWFCGSLIACDHCRQNMRALRPEEVAAAVRQEWLSAEGQGGPALAAKQENA